MAKRDAAGARAGFNARAAVPFADDSDDEEPQHHGGIAKKQRADTVAGGGWSGITAPPPPPTDPEVRKCAERLAEFVAKKGRSIEDITRQRNPGNTPFKFLFDSRCPDYRYYEYKLREHERQQQQGSAALRAPAAATRPAAAAAAAAATAAAAAAATRAAAAAPSVGLLKKQELARESHVASALRGGDSVAAMEAFARLAERNAERNAEREEEEERKRRPELLNETSFDRRRTVAVYKDDGKRGHHMGDFIPKEELAKLLAKTNDGASKAHAAQLEAKHRIGADNVGHRLLQKMGWKEGQGLGADGNKGAAAPVAASGQARNTTGLGATSATEVTEGDDMYEAYRKRMQLGYKHRPNPLGNPRKAYDK